MYCMFPLRGDNVGTTLRQSRDDEYERICQWIQQLNAQYENKEVTHPQLLEEAREIGVAVVGLCREKKWMKILAKG